MYIKQGQTGSCPTKHLKKTKKREKENDKRKKRKKERQRRRRQRRRKKKKKKKELYAYCPSLPPTPNRPTHPLPPPQPAVSNIFARPVILVVRHLCLMVLKRKWSIICHQGFHRPLSDVLKISVI